MDGWMCACMRVGMTGTPGTASSVVSRSREAAPKASPHSRHQSPSLPQRSVAVPSSAALDPVCARACVRACHAMRGSSRRRARPPALSGRRASYETPPAHTGLHQTRLNQTSRSAHRRRAHLADQGTHTSRSPRSTLPSPPRATTATRRGRRRAGIWKERRRDGGHGAKAGEEAGARESTSVRKSNARPHARPGRPQQGLHVAPMARCRVAVHERVVSIGAAMRR